MSLFLPSFSRNDTTEVKDDSFLDDIFSDSEDQEFEIQPELSSKKTNEVNSLIDVAPKLTLLSKELENYKTNEQKIERIDLIPEGTSPEELVNAINMCFESKDYEQLKVFLENFDICVLSETQQHQLSILKYYFDKEVKIEEIVEKETDSRILSILFFALSIGKDKKIEVYYLLESALEFVKSSDVAPISLFYSDFNLKYVLERICIILCDLFASNPLLKSEIEKLSNYVNADLIKNLILESKGDEDEISDDFSDSFFDEVKELKNNKPIQLLNINSCVTNLLDLSLNKVSHQSIALPAPPSTLTFLLPNGEDSFSSNNFYEWLNKCLSKMSSKEIINNSNYSLDETDSKSVDKLNSVEKEYEKIYRKFTKAREKIVLPESPDFALSLPIIHFLNSKSDVAITLNGIQDQNIFSLEFDAHNALEKNNTKLYLDTLESFLKLIPKDIKQKSIEPLKEKRPFPNNQNNDNIDQNTIQFMALIDASLMLNMRSPLTFIQYSFQVNILDQSHPIFNRSWITNALYNLYTSTTFFPYLSFRAAFVITDNLIDKKTEYSSGLGFEAIILLVEQFPVLITSTFCRSAFFVLGEAFDSIGKYYYTTLCHDCSLSLIINNRILSSKAAQIAYKSQDSLRAAFYYLETLKMFIKCNQTDESLYGLQILSCIFHDNAQYTEGVRLIKTILSSTNSVKGVRFSTIQRKIKRNRYSSFRQSSQTFSKPIVIGSQSKTENITIILSTAALALFMIKINQFKIAEELLNHIDSLNDNDSILRLTSFLRNKILYTKGDFQSLINSISPNVLSFPRTKINTGKFTFLSFDYEVETLKLLAKSSFLIQMHQQFLFWSEMICLVSLNHLFSLNELGKGLILRANALINQKVGSSIQYQLSDAELSIGNFVKNGNTTFTKEFIINEALSSLSMAKICFDKVGNTSNHLNSMLLFCEFLIQHFFIPKVMDNVESEQITISRIHYLTELATQKQIRIDELTETQITPQNYIDIISSNCQMCENLAKIIMNPFYIIRLELIQGIVCLHKGKTEESKEYLDFIINNLRKFFFIGKVFAYEQISLYGIKKIVSFFDLLTLFLISFPRDIINKYLFVFEWRNDILIQTKIKNSRFTNEYEERLACSGINPQPSICELKNTMYPDFIHLLNKFLIVPIKSNAKCTQTRWKLINLIRRIRLNTKKYSNGKLSESMLTETNTNICSEIENYISTNTKSKSIETFDNSVVSIFLYHNFITISASIKHTKVKIINPFNIRFSNSDKSMEFDLCSDFFDTQFLKSIYYLISTKSSKGKLDLNQFSEQCIKYRNILFSEINNDIEPMIIPDNFETTKSKKGKLSSMCIKYPVLNIISDIYTQFLPYEMFFPNRTIVRNINNESIPPSKCTCFPFRNEKEKIEEFQSRRTKEILQTIFSSIDFCESPKLDKIKDNTSIFPSLLINCSHDISKKYSFCNFKQDKLVNSEDEKDNDDQSDLFIFSYSDLCDMPETLYQTFKQFPKASFLFIPANFMKDAFKIMDKIFERNEKRKRFFEANQSNPDYNVNMCIFKSPLQFIGTIQQTLMKELNIPIPIITSNY